MKVLVCIKQVPDMESRFRVNAEGIWYEDSDLAWRMNEYDEYAVEQAVQLKEQVGGCRHYRPLHRPGPGEGDDEESPRHRLRPRRAHKG